MDFIILPIFYQLSQQTSVSVLSEKKDCLPLPDKTSSNSSGGNSNHLLFRPFSPTREELFELISSLKEEVLTQSQQAEEWRDRYEDMTEKVQSYYLFH